MSEELNDSNSIVNASPLASSMQCFPIERENQTMGREEEVLISMKGNDRILGKRKIPGPIGTWSVHAKRQKQHHDNMTFSQTFHQDNNYIWAHNSWKKMNLEYADQANNNNIRKIKLQVKTGKSNEQFDFLAGMIIDNKCAPKLSNVTLSLKDPTGEISAIISSDLYNEQLVHLIKNSVIILRNFSLLPVTGKFSLDSHYIIITKHNLEAIYTAHHDYFDKPKISLRALEEIKEQNNYKKMPPNENFSDDDFLQIKSEESLNKHNIDKPQRKVILSNSKLPLKTNNQNINSIKNLHVTTNKVGQGVARIPNPFDTHMSNLDLNLDGFPCFPQNPTSGTQSAEKQAEDKQTATIKANSTIISNISTIETLPIDSALRYSTKSKTIADATNISAAGKRFKYVKNKNPGHTVHDSNEPQTQNVNTINCKVSETSIKADKSENEQLVREMFDGLDASIIFDDF